MKVSSGYTRALQRIREKVAPVPVGRFLQKIDQTQLRQIQQRYSGSPEPYAKYAHVERWLKRHLKNVRRLGLDRSPPKTILDLGCGGGFFLFICREFGHSVQGVDIDEFPLLRDLVGLLRIPRHVWRIEALRPLPDFGRRFDWITAFSTRFNRDREDRQVWGVEEWNFFLDDLAQRLAPGGRAFLEINSGKTRSFYPNELKELFRRRGATLERDYVDFADGIA